MMLSEIYSRAESSLKSQSEKIEFFGWFLHVYRQKEHFTQADIRNCYNELHLALPSSLSPWFQSLARRSPKHLLRDGSGYRLERRIRDQFTKKFGDVVEKPTSTTIKTLQQLSGAIPDPDERKFIEEAITCLQHSAPRAATVLGWCAAVYRMQKKIESNGFDKFNAASKTVKNQTSGKYKRWNKEFSITTFGELQTTVFDSDLIIVLEGMGLIDGQQAGRLVACFQYRCDSAHPGHAPIDEAHLVVFFTDIIKVVLANPKFN